MNQIQIPYATSLLSDSRKALIRYYKKSLIKQLRKSAKYGKNILKIYDYQLYISNEIRNASNPALPAIHAFERFLMKELKSLLYQNQYLQLVHPDLS